MRGIASSEAFWSNDDLASGFPIIGGAGLWITSLREA